MPSTVAGNILVKLSEMNGVIIKDDMVFVDVFPIGVLWPMNKEYVEVNHSSFIVTVKVDEK